MKAKYAKRIRSGINKARENVLYIKKKRALMSLPDVNDKLEIKAWWHVMDRFYPDPIDTTPLPPIPGIKKENN